MKVLFSDISDCCDKVIKMSNFREADIKVTSHDFLSFVRKKGNGGRKTTK